MSNDKEQLSFNRDGPIIVGGTALQESLEKGEFSMSHNFQWSKEERRDIRNCLAKKFKGEPVDRFLEMTAEHIAHHARYTSPPSSFKPKGKKERADTLIQDQKDLKEIQAGLKDVVSKIQSLGELGSAHFRFRLYCDGQPENCETIDDYETIEDPEIILMGMVDAAEFADTAISKSIPTSIRRIPNWEATARYERYSLIGRLASSYKTCFNAQPTIYAYGAFDNFLTVVFRVVGMKDIKDRKKLIKQHRYDLPIKPWEYDK